MQKLSLFIDSGEALRIEGDKYLALDSYWDVLVEVTKEQFIDCLKNKFNWAKDSWCKQLRDEYAIMCSAVGI